MCFFALPQTPGCRVDAVSASRKHSPNMTSMNYLYALLIFRVASPPFTVPHRHSITSIFIRFEEPMERARCTIALNVPRRRQSMRRAPNTVSVVFLLFVLFSVLFCFVSNCVLLKCVSYNRMWIVAEHENVLIFRRNRRSPYHCAIQPSNDGVIDVDKCHPWRHGLFP